MSLVERKIQELRENGIYSARRVDIEAIERINNMQEFDYWAIDIQSLEAYLGLLSTHVQFLQQEVNSAEAREIAFSNEFKREALPYTLGTKIRSVEERWIYAASLSEELFDKFNTWQDAVIDSVLKKDLADPVKHKLNVLKKIYDDRRLEGTNKNIHKYNEGS
jgi:hypothetical protein